jgi:hypothetical protein
MISAKPVRVNSREALGVWLPKRRFSASQSPPIIGSVVKALPSFPYFADFAVKV